MNSSSRLPQFNDWNRISTMLNDYSSRFTPNIAISGCIEWPAKKKFLRRLYSVDGGQEVSHYGGVAGHFRHGSLAVSGQRGVPRRADIISKSGLNSLTTELSAIIIGRRSPLMIILFNRRHATNQ